MGSGTDTAGQPEAWGTETRPARPAIQAIAHNITELLDVRDNIRNIPGFTPSDICSMIKELCIN